MGLTGSSGSGGSSGSSGNISSGSSRANNMVAGCQPWQQPVGTGAAAAGIQSKGWGGWEGSRLGLLVEAAEW
jgi:hypothetical protein